MSAYLIDEKIRQMLSCLEIVLISRAVIALNLLLLRKVLSLRFAAGNEEI